MGKHTVLFSLCCLTKANNAATISLTVLKGKWPLQLIAVSLPLNSSISSKHLFIAVGDFGAKKKIIWNLTPPVQFSVKIPTPPGKCSSQMLEDCPGGYWRFDLIGAALWALKFRKRGLSLKTCDFIKFGTPTWQELWRFATDRILFTFCSGAFALYFRPYRWVFDSLSAPIRRNLPSIKKRRANSPEVSPGREWAQLELTDTLDKDSFCFTGTLRWLTVSVLVRKSRIFTC